MPINISMTTNVSTMAVFKNGKHWPTTLFMNTTPLPPHTHPALMITSQISSTHEPSCSLVIASSGSSSTLLRLLDALPDLPAPLFPTVGPASTSPGGHPDEDKHLYSDLPSKLRSRDSKPCTFGRHCLNSPIHPKARNVRFPGSRSTSLTVPPPFVPNSRLSPADIDAHESNHSSPMEFKVINSWIIEKVNSPSCSKQT